MCPYSLGRTKHNMELSKKHFMLISFCVILSSLGIEASKEPPRTGKHLVLIHGSCLQAWSLYKLVTLLKSSGHNVTAKIFWDQPTASKWYTIKFWLFQALDRITILTKTPKLIRGRANVQIHDRNLKVLKSCDKCK